MPTLVHGDSYDKQAYETLKMKESMPTEYYLIRLTDLPKKKSKDLHKHKNQD